MPRWTFPATQARSNPSESEAVDVLAREVQRTCHDDCVVRQRIDNYANFVGSDYVALVVSRSVLQSLDCAGFSRTPPLGTFWAHQNNGQIGLLIARLLEGLETTSMCRSIFA